MTTTTNPHEAASRARKVTALIAMATAHEVTLEDMRVMGPKEWGMLAQAAGVNPPSEEAQRDCIAALGKARRGAIR